MDKVINLLEILATRPEFQDPVLLKEAVEQTDLDEEIKEAINNKDIEKLEMILDVRTTIRCMLFPAEDDEPSDDENDDDEQIERSYGFINKA